MNPDFCTWITHYKIPFFDCLPISIFVKQITFFLQFLSLKLDLATTAASLDTCLVTAPRREPPQTLVPATIATRQVICPGTVHHQLEVAAVKTPASATNVARRATCPVNAQTHLHNLHNPPVEAAASVTRMFIQAIYTKMYPGTLGHVHISPILEGPQPNEKIIKNHFLNSIILNRTHLNFLWFGNSYKKHIISTYIYCIIMWFWYWAC